MQPDGLQVVDGTEDSAAPDVEPQPLPEDQRVLMVAPSMATMSIAFTDVSNRAGHPSYSKFAREIAWLADTGITRGWQLKSGEREYRPLSTISRDAMAAFLYRYAGQPAHNAPARSPFLDLKPKSTAFYSEITWAADAGVTNGWKVSGGSAFRPYEAISREAMAAFLYRFAGSPAVELPRTSPFSDVSTSSQFYKEIIWLSQTGATTGWKTSRGAEFRPRASITRDAMAAFLYRLDHAGVSYSPRSLSAPVLRHSVMHVEGASSLNLRSGPSTAYPVVATRSRGAALTTTGAVSPSGWIEVRVDGKSAWASGYYLVGSNGSAVNRVKATYTNGKIPRGDLCTLSWDSTEILLCPAAADLERLNRAFRDQFGRNIPVNDSYRDLEAQIRARVTHGYLAAIPGTSNHGWGLAIDISGNSLPGGYQGTQYLWLRQQLTGYNWVLPAWARPGGSKPEAWHFEYTG